MGETEMDTDRHAAPTELGASSITGSINMPILTELWWGLDDEAPQDPVKYSG